MIMFLESPMLIFVLSMAIVFICCYIIYITPDEEEEENIW